MLHELVPKAALIAVLINPKFADFESRLRELSAAARALSRRIEYYTASTDAELELAFSRIAQENAASFSLRVTPSSIVEGNKIIAFAATSRLPTILPVSRVHNRRRADDLWDQHHGGISPNWHLCRTKFLREPSQESYRFTNRSSSNLSSISRPSKALGLEIPDKLLALADEVIDMSIGASSSRCLAARRRQAAIGQCNNNISRSWP